MVAAGIALLRDSPKAPALTRAAAWMGLAVTLLVGMAGWGLAGWPMTLLGLLWPTFLLWRVRPRRV